MVVKLLLGQSATNMDTMSKLTFINKFKYSLFNKLMPMFNCLQEVDKSGKGKCCHAIFLKVSGPSFHFNMFQQAFWVTLLQKHDSLSERPNQN